MTLSEASRFSSNCSPLTCERESKKKNLLALAFILESSEQHLLFIKKCARVSKTASDGLRFILSARRIFIYLALSSFELSSIVLESCPFGLFQRENQLSLKKIKRADYDAGKTLRYTHTHR